MENNVFRDTVPTAEDVQVVRKLLWQITMREYQKSVPIFNIVYKNSRFIDRIFGAEIHATNAADVSSDFLPASALINLRFQKKTSAILTFPDR